MGQAPRALAPHLSAQHLFGAELRHWRELRGLSQNELGTCVHFSGDYVSKVEKAERFPPVALAEKCDIVLETGGILGRMWPTVQHARVSHADRPSPHVDAVTSRDDGQSTADVVPQLTEAHAESLGGQKGREVGAAPTRREVFGYVGAGLTAVGLEQITTNQPRVVHALEATRQPGPTGTDTTELENMEMVVDHYKRTFRRVRPAELYDELLGVRVHAGRLLGSLGSASGNRDFLVMTSWLSNLLALVTCDLKDHAASLVWCADAERWSQVAGCPELAGWAVQTKVLLSFYGDHARDAVAQAQRGQVLAPPSTAVHAKLLVQEMRAWARLGNDEKVTSLRRHAETAIAKLPANTPQAGAFSIKLADDPPYTATSLLLLGRYSEAVEVTRRVISTFYANHAGEAEDPSGFARTQLILALALARSGQLDEACAAGSKALDSSCPAWPTVVLARRLDRLLRLDFAGTTQAREYHELYVATLGERPSTCGRGIRPTGPAS